MTWFSSRPLRLGPWKAACHFNALFRKTGCFFVVCFGGDLDQRVIVKRRNMEIPLEMERPRTKEQLQGRNKLITWLSLKLELGWAMGPLRMPDLRGECWSPSAKRPDCPAISMCCWSLAVRAPSSAFTISVSYSHYCCSVFFCKNLFTLIT